MDHKDFLILPIVGILIMINIWFLPLIPSFSLVSAYILVRNYESESNKRLVSRVALIFFLLVFLLFIYLPLGGGLLIGLPIFLLNVSAIFICLLLIIDFIIPLREGKSVVSLGFLLYPSLSIILFISHLKRFGNSYTLGAIVSTYNEYVILLAILLSLTMIYLLKLRNDYEREEKAFEEFDSRFVKEKKIFKKDEGNVGTIVLYVTGGLLLITCIYILFTAKDMRYATALFYDLIPSIVLSVWGATFLALSSKHRIADCGYILFGVILLPFFFLNFPRGFSILSLETTIGITRILFGIFFTLILLGYDMRLIPRKGLIEYSIYGLSFIPLVSSLIFVTPYINYSHIALVFALLILLKIIVTTGYVYKRIGIE